VAENVTDNNKGGNNDEEVEIQKIKIVKGKVKETIEQMSTDQKLQFYAILSIYITNNLDRFPTASVNIMGKVRNSKSDEEQKMLLMNQYNQYLDDLPNHYIEKFDVNIICDLILDLLRYKVKPVIDAASLV
jgi:hypothetical protein